MGSLGFRNLTWQQVVVSLALLAAVVVAYKLFGELPAGVVLVISGIVNLLLGRRPDDGAQPECPDAVRTRRGRDVARARCAPPA